MIKMIVQKKTITNIVKDTYILKIARGYARQILDQDPSLMLPKNSAIKNTYAQIAKYRNQILN